MGQEDIVADQPAAEVETAAVTTMAGAVGGAVVIVVVVVVVGVPMMGDRCSPCCKLSVSSRE